MLSNFVPRITVVRPRAVPNITERFSLGTPEIIFGSVGNISDDDDEKLRVRVRVTISQPLSAIIYLEFKYLLFTEFII